MQRSTTPTVAVALQDGFYSCGTGAGRSNRAFLQTLIPKLLPAVRLVVLPIRLVQAGSEYNSGWHYQMHDLIHRAGGQVLPIDNGTAGHRRFGGLKAFRHACASAANAIHRHLLPSAGPLLLITFDCPFYGLADALTANARSSLVAVARSTAALHDPGDTPRIEWERKGMHQLVAAGGRIAAISTHMRTHLSTEYRIPETAILDLPNGLTAEDWQHIPAPDTRLLPPAARSGFILSMGRAVPYKGFDDLLDALTLLRTRGTHLPHTVLAAVTDDPALSPYQQHLAQQINVRKLNATFLPRFNPALRSVLTHPALAAVVVPSRVEPFGRIPLEAFVAGAAPVVATTAGGLAELVTERTGYTATPGDPASLATAIARALAADTTQRARLRAAGRHLAITRYNYDTTVRRFLHQMAPWATSPVAAAAEQPILRAATPPGR
ncbi:glycosyltransferase family 4 protein [Actinoallomurus sp. CA-150999]|uniref:glycosyltransferase family 4 protein n=1 Tax=Actinoallomurus sp. CA-150999 TaxID=3239887 RepID=UPI003D8EA548